MVGTGWIREARWGKGYSLAICYADWEHEVNARPALELGVGFSGIAGWIPSTASQCAFHLTPAELAIPGGSGCLRYVAKSISSSGTWYRCWGGPEVVGIVTCANAGWGNGLGGTRTGWEVSARCSRSYHNPANSIQTPREDRVAWKSPERGIAHLHVQRLHRMFDILGQERLPFPVDHELLRLLQDQVEAVFDIPREQVRGTLSERVDRQGVGDLLMRRRGGVQHLNIHGRQILTVMESAG